MEALPNEIVLRPRFRKNIAKSKELVLSNMVQRKRAPYILNRIDDHIIIKFSKDKMHFWSPQLHLEIIEKDAQSCEVHGLFGPSPALWTFFMFLHFGVATAFIILGIWAYSNGSLDRPYFVQIGLMVMMVLLWIALYIFGRLGKRKGKPQMQELYNFMEEGLS